MTGFTFYPIEATYRIIDGKAVIFLIGRSGEGGHVIVADNTFPPYFYIKLKVQRESTVLMKRLLDFKLEDEKGGAFFTHIEPITKIYLGKKIDLLKAHTNLPGSVPKLREEVRKMDEVEDIFEYDIPFAKRYLIDKGITMLHAYTVEAVPFSYPSRVPCFMLSSISPGEGNRENLNILAFDIETYSPHGRVMVPEEHPIIMLAVSGKSVSKVITWKRFKTERKDIEFVESEAALLEHFFRLIESQRPDIIATYNGDGFDFPYIITRAKKHKIPLDIGLDHSEIIKNKAGQVEIVGMPHIYVYRFVKRIVRGNLQTQSDKLDAVAKELLGEGKHESDVSVLYKAWDEEQGLEQYCAYNLHDAMLTLKLAEKLLPNLIEFSRIVGQPLFDVNRMGFSQLIEWFLFKQALAENQLMPNKPSYRETRDRMRRSFVGGYVFQPTPGLYENILMFDFRSLYPTIISSHNIGPDTLSSLPPTVDALPVPLDDAKIFFVQERRSFLAKQIDDLISRRIRVKEMMKESPNPFLDARQNSLKLLANSFYGYLGFIQARFYNFDVGRSVTAYGRHYITMVIEKAQAAGFKVIYSDNDSIFIGLEEKKREDALRFVRQINETLPGVMELEYEGNFKAALFVPTRGNEGGAKKKYALLDEKDRIIIKGFETVRRNWSIIAKEVQREVISILLRTKNAKEATAYAQEIIEKLRKHMIPKDQVIIFTQLTKDIEGYESKGPHVKVAMRMKERGIPVSGGSIIQYIICQGAGSIGERAKFPDEVIENEYDAEYYINNQIVPSVDRLLAVFGVDPATLAEIKSQSKLESFF